ncbi:MAG: nascent polypeptide-associated complex protein [Methanocellales archaeon]
MIPGMGRGMNPKKLQQMMKQMGIEISEIEGVKEVIIRTIDKEIVFKDAQVTVMEARGIKTYQIIGTPVEKAIEIKIPEADIKLVMEQTGSSEEKARAALIETKGDLAEAILKLTSK